MNFENIFSKYARTVPDKLSRAEIWHMTQSSRNAFDIFGWSVSLSICNLPNTVTLHKHIMRQQQCDNFNLILTGLRVNWSGELYIFLQRMTKATYQRKLYDAASMEAYLNTVLKFVKALLLRWTDSIGYLNSRIVLSLIPIFALNTSFFFLLGKGERLTSYCLMSSLLNIYIFHL